MVCIYGSDNIGKNYYKSLYTIKSYGLTVLRVMSAYIQGAGSGAVRLKCQQFPFWPQLSFSRKFVFRTGT
jgi:hypothetical protein